MAIALTCPCGRNLRLKDELAGKRIRCPNCSQVLLVNVPDDEIVDDFVVDEPPKKSAAVTDKRPPSRPDDIPVVEAVDDEPPRRPRRKKRRRPRYEDEGRRGGIGISISPGIIGGLLMMFVAVVWFILGLYFGWIFFYPPILFILGAIRVGLSLFGHDPD